MLSGVCPEYCGKVQIFNETSNCGKCPWSTRANLTTSLCEDCTAPLSLYDWLYICLMTFAPLLFNAYFIDYYATHKCSRTLNLFHHLSSLVECSLACICSLVMLQPIGLPYLVTCGVTKFRDWYPMFFNPYINFTEKLHCTQEVVYPLYSYPFIYYALCLLFLTIFRTLLCCKYPFRKTGSNMAVYASLYILPIVTLVHAVFAGFIYYGFAYLLLVATLSTNAYYLSNYEDQDMKSLVKDSFTKPKNFLVLLLHCICIAFCFVSMDLFNSPATSGLIVVLTPFPTLFYILTVNFSVPSV